VVPAVAPAAVEVVEQVVLVAMVEAQDLKLVELV
jgi:hypothetical protein